MTIVLMTATVALLAIKKEPGLYAFIGILLLVSFVSNLTYQQPPAPKNWVAINTHLGAAPNNVFGLVERQEKLIQLTQQALNSGAKVVIYPENVAVDWISGTQNQWHPIASQAKQLDATIILGAQQDLPDSSFNNILLILGKDGTRYYSARQPMPLGLWRPWSRYTYHSHWNLPGKFVVQNKEVAYLICYEQMIPWPILSSFITAPRPEIVISSANQWFSKPSGYTKQHNVMSAFVRLFAVPSITAINAI